MTIFLWLFQLALVVVMLPLAPVLVLLSLPFVHRDATNILPPWLQWINTWDDCGENQGMYEPKVKSVYDRFGWWAKTWYWLGIRNQAYGLFHALAPVIRFYDGAVWDRHGVLTTVTQDGRIYWQVEFSGDWSATKRYLFRLGWKLFSIERFFTGDKTGNPDYDRPTFCLTIYPYRSK